MSDMFLIRNDLKQGDALSPLLFNFALEYAIRRVQVNQDGVKLNCTYQLLAYADDVNILGGSVHNVKKNAEALRRCIEKSQDNAHNTKVACSSRVSRRGVLRWCLVSECAEWRGWIWKRLIIARVFMCVCVASAVCDFLISAVWRKLTNKGYASSCV